MAKSFSTLKDPKLGLLDTITFGKLKDCRVCDVIEDHYEYLIWAEKNGYMRFQQIVLETIQEAAHFEKWVPPETPVEAVDTYMKNREMFPAGIWFSDMDDDIPF